MKFDIELYKKIIGGNSIAFIGAGISAAQGYPDWENLCKKVLELSLIENSIHNKNEIKELISISNYAEAFELLQKAISRETLLKYLKTLLVASTPDNDNVYKLLTSWPFACYLTTNFDKEIEQHLSMQGEKFTTLRNTSDDLSLIHNGMKNYIFQIHSDLDHIDDAVITSSDYERFYNGDDKAYYREALKSLFKLFDIIIFGYGFNDEDAIRTAEYAKKYRSLKYPMFMFASDFSVAKISEFSRKYGIQVINYKNDDGKHSQLFKILSVYDQMIKARRLDEATISMRSEETNMATSLYLYRVMKQNHLKADVDNLILASLPLCTQAPISIAELKKHLYIDIPDIENRVLLLSKNGCVVENDGKYKLSELNSNDLLAIRRQREHIYHLSMEQFKKDLLSFSPTISNTDKYINAAAECLNLSFYERGLALTRIVFSNKTMTNGELVDIFNNIIKTASQFSDPDDKIAYIKTMQKMLLDPTQEQSEYLAAMAQGYFLYHLSGRDSAGLDARRNVFHETSWFLDSNILIPLFAKGSYPHDLLLATFEKMKSLKAKMFTTSAIVEEVEKHLEWACYNGPDSPAFFDVATLQGDIKQNLFIDGFIHLSEAGEIASFQEYLSKVLSKGEIHETLQKEYGIVIIEPKKILPPDDYLTEINNKSNLIREIREKNHTYRNENQVITEAELQQLIKRLIDNEITLPGVAFEKNKIYFISQSKIFNHISNSGILTWSTEAVYRYITSLSSDPGKPQEMQKCMLNEYYSLGVEYIDKKIYTRFFGSTIDSAKLKFLEEKDKYIQFVESNLSLAACRT